MNQNVDKARANLASQNITVAEVVPYQPGIKDSVTAITNIRSLKAGQEVKLYEENGTVRYYSIVKKSALVDNDAVRTLQEQTAQLKKNNEDLKSAHAQLTRQNDDAAKKLEAQSGDLVKLRDELKENQKTAAVKDEEIKTLKNALDSLRKDQAEIATVFRSEKFTKLLNEMGGDKTIKTTKTPKNPK